MCSRIDWNKINDEDSSESETEIQSVKSIRKQQPVKEIIVEENSKNVSIQTQRPSITDHLVKVQNSKEDKVWLYTPHYVKRKYEEVQIQLRSMIQIIKVLPIKSGWHILLSKENAKNFLLPKQRKKTLQMRFLYSDRNQQKRKDENNDKKNNLRQNQTKKKTKFVQKGKVYQKSENIELAEKEIKKFDDFNRKEQINGKEDKNNQQRDHSKQWTKPNKIKYIQKQVVQSKTTIIPKIEQIKQTKIISPQINIDLDQKTTQPDTPILKSRDNIESSQKKLSQKINQQESICIEQDNKFDEVQDKQIKAKVCEILSDHDSEQSLERMRKNLKKKNKKVKTKQKQRIDANNPFAQLQFIK